MTSLQASRWRRPADALGDAIRRATIAEYDRPRQPPT